MLIIKKAKTTKDSVFEKIGYKNVILSRNH